MDNEEKQPGQEPTITGIPPEDIAAWKRLCPEEVPERPESSRPRDTNGQWLDVNALFR